MKDCAEFGLDLLTLFDGAKDFVGDGGLKNLKTFRGKWFTTSKGTVTGLGQKGKNAQVLYNQVGDVAWEGSKAAWSAVTDSKIYKSCETVWEPAK